MIMKRPEMSKRHIAQIVRRKMLQKIKPSGKIYNRNKYKTEEV